MGVRGIAAGKGHPLDLLLFLLRRTRLLRRALGSAPCFLLVSLFRSFVHSVFVFPIRCLVRYLFRVRSSVRWFVRWFPPAGMITPMAFAPHASSTWRQRFPTHAIGSFSLHSLFSFYSLLSLLISLHLFPLYFISHLTPLYFI